MRTNVTRRSFIRGAIGSATLAAVGAAPRIASAAKGGVKGRADSGATDALDEIDEPIVIDDAWVLQNGPVLEDVVIRVSENFESGCQNTVIDIRTHGVTVRNVKVYGHRNLEEYPERWQQGINYYDNLPGMHPALRAIRAESVDGLTIERVTVSGFPVEAMRFDNVSNLTVKHFAFDHVYTGILIKDNDGPSSNVTISRLQGKSLWRPYDAADKGSVPSREHTGNTGGNGLALRNVKGLTIDTLEMIGEQKTSAKLVGCSDVTIRNFVGATLQVTTVEGLVSRNVRIERSEFSRMNEFGAGATSPGRNMLMITGGVEGVEVTGCKILGGMPLWMDDGSDIALDSNGETQWRGGHGIQLTHNHLGEFPRDVHVERCVFSGHNGLRGGFECAALHNNESDGTADQSDRLVGGLTSFFENNDFVDQVHVVLGHDGRYID